MLTAEKIEAMDDAKDGPRWNLFADMAAARYGATGINRKLGEEFGINSQTYFSWMRKPGSIPYVYFFCLERMNQTAAERDDQVRATMQDLTNEFRGIATKLGDLAATYGG